LTIFMSETTAARRRTCRTVEEIASKILAQSGIEKRMF